MADPIAEAVPVDSVFARPVAMVFAIDVLALRRALASEMFAAFSSFSAAVEPLLRRGDALAAPLGPRQVVPGVRDLPPVAGHPVRGVGDGAGDVAGQPDAVRLGERHGVLVVEDVLAAAEVHQLRALFTHPGEALRGTARALRVPVRRAGEPCGVGVERVAVAGGDVAQAPLDLGGRVGLPVGSG
jgi:hypothetical protein